MEIRKRLSNDGWVDLGENIAIKLDYPTVEQYTVLENIVMNGDVTQQSMYEYYKKLIQFCIKDWKGFDEKCEIVGNQLTDDLLYLITYSIKQTLELGQLINNEIGFFEVDKKK